MNNSKNDHQITFKGFKDSSLMIAVSVLTAIIAQKAIDWSENGSFGFTGGVIISTLIVAAWIYAFYKPLTRLIGKAHFAVTVLLFLAGGTALGTFVRQHAAPAYYEDTYGAFFGRLVQFAEFGDVFHSWWYVGLFLLLTASLVVISLTRKFNKENIGFHLSHLSLILVFFGVWADFFFGMRGIMHMEVDKDNNVVNVFQQNTNYLTGQETLDFTLRLDKFESEKFEPDFRVQIWKKHEGNKPQIITTVPANSTEKQSIHATDISFKVLEYFPDHYWGYEGAVPSEQMEPKDPILIAKVKTENGEQNVQLRSNYEGYNLINDPYGNSNIEFTWELNPEHKTLISGHQKTIKHKLQLVGDKGSIADYGISEGEKYPIPNTAYSLRFAKFYSHLLFDEDESNYFNGPDTNANPGVEIQLLGAGVSITFYLYSNFHGHNSPALVQAQTLTGLDFHYSFNTGNRILVVGSENSIYHINNDTIKKETLEMGYPYLFDGRLDAYFQVMHIFPDAEQVKSVPMKKSDKAENPIALIEVEQPDKEPVQKYIYPPKGTKEALLMIEGSPYFLALASTREQETKYWKSHLSVLDASGNVLKESLIQVNEPLQYAGYRFYQTDFDPKRPNYSGIGVSREPGLYIIYLGFYLLVTGVFMMFYMRKEQKAMIPASNGNGAASKEEAQALLNGGAVKVEVEQIETPEVKKAKL